VPDRRPFSLRRLTAKTDLVRRISAGCRLQSRRYDQHSNRHSAGLKQHRITVLLVDDQAIIGEAVRRMLAAESDIELHFCSDPTQALAAANAVGRP